MGDTLEPEADPAPPPPGTNKVEITVGEHTVLVESQDPLDDVVSYALGIYDQTRRDGRRTTIGFEASAGGQFERAEPYGEASGLDGQEDDRARRLCRDGTTKRLDLGANLVGRGEAERRMGGLESQEPVTRRLGVENPAGHHRARFRPVPVDREQRPLP